MAVPYPHAVEAYPRVRQSILSDFDNCFRTGHLSLRHERGWSSAPAARGQLVHRTIARCLDYLEDQSDFAVGQENTVPVDVALELLEEMNRQADVPVESADGMGDELGVLPIRQLAEARITVKTWAHYQRYTVSEIGGVEKRLEATLMYPGEGGEAVERAVTGKLDLLLMAGEHATVVDWKDTWGIPGERLKVRGGVVVGGVAEHDPARPMGAAEQSSTQRANVSEEGYFQQRFYALLVFLTYPRIQRVTLREFYLRYASGSVLDRKGRPINPVREATVERTELGEIQAEMAALIERFDRAQETYLTTERTDGESDSAFERRRSRAFKPQPGSHCSYCIDPDACPVWPKARKVGRISTQQDAERLAGVLQVTRARASQIGAALKSWSNIRGEVAVKDAKRPRVYGPVRRTRTISPTPEEVEQGRRQGIPAAELFRTEEYVEFCIHTPEEQHPFAREARAEEEMLLAAEKQEASKS